MTLSQQITLRLLLARLRIALFKNDQVGFHRVLAEIRREGYGEVADAIATKMKIRLLVELALEQIPWANPHTPLHTWN